MHHVHVEHNSKHMKEWKWKQNKFAFLIPQIQHLGELPSLSGVTHGPKALVCRQGRVLSAILCPTLWRLRHRFPGWPCGLSPNCSLSVVLYSWRRSIVFSVTLVTVSLADDLIASLLDTSHCFALCILALHMEFKFLLIFMKYQDTPESGYAFFGLKTSFYLPSHGLTWWKRYLFFSWAKHVHRMRICTWRLVCTLSWAPSWRNYIQQQNHHSLAHTHDDHCGELTF